MRQCVRFRELVAAMITREMRAQYRGSVLGSAWIILQPLLYLMIYYVVFSQVFKQSETVEGFESLHALSMFCGLVPWIAFAEALSRGTGCVLSNGNLIQKYAFPSELLPIYLVGVSLINTVIGFVLLSVAVLIFGGHLPQLIWLFPLVLLLQGIFTLGVVYIVASVTVYIRDIGQMVPMILTFGFFMSPIFMFAKSPTTPELLQTVLRWNPITYLLSLYREIFIWTPEILIELNGEKYWEEARHSVALPFTKPGEVPWHEVMVFGTCAVVVLFIGLNVFKKLQPGFADEV